MSAVATIDPRPPTRHYRIKKVLVADRDAVWADQMRDALQGCGYYMNQITRADEVGRRVYERVYDLVVLSTSLGRKNLDKIFREMGKHADPPQVMLLAAPGDACTYEDPSRVPSVTILRYPVDLEDVIYVSKALLGSPWEDGRIGS